MLHATRIIEEILNLIVVERRIRRTARVRFDREPVRYRRRSIEGAESRPECLMHRFLKRHLSHVGECYEPGVSIVA